MEPYTFVFEGYTVTYQRATVRTGLETSRIRQKLIDAMGYVDQMPNDIYANVSTYADVMARSKSDAPWWCHSNMNEAEIQTAYDLFLDQDEELYFAFNRAERATMPPKKTTLPVLPTSP